MREIVLGGGPRSKMPIMYARIDSEDFALVSQYKWSARFNACTKSWYAYTTIRTPERSFCIYMHRMILGLPFGDKRQGDHIATGDTLNNQRSNLRIATQNQNKMNKRMYANNSLGVKGVTRDKGLFKAQLQKDGKRVYLGRRKTIEEAKALYDAAAIRHFGEYAHV